MDKTPINWANETRKLSELIPWEENPRQIKADEAKRLEESLGAFGQIHPIAIGQNNTILDGHQRQGIWSLSKEYGPDYVVDVRVASRELTDAEHKKLVVYLHQGAVGEWNFQALGNWDIDEKLLLDWGFDEKQLGIFQDAEPPDEFKEYDEDIETEHECPKCGYKWS